MDLLQPMMVAALIISGMGVAILGSAKVPLARRLQMAGVWAGFAAACLVLIAVATRDVMHGYAVRHTPAVMSRWAPARSCRCGAPRPRPSPTGSGR